MSDILNKYLTGTVVPNKHPLIDSSLGVRLALVGEAPGRDEELSGEPFVGKSGRLLTGVIGRLGIVRQSCFIGNICQVRPPNNELEHFSWDGPEIQSGLSQLKTDLDAFQPNICVLLGKYALKAARGGGSISDYRGTLFVSQVDGPFKGRKCIATFHPAFVLREMSNLVMLRLDLKRALSEGKSPNLHLPERRLITPYTFNLSQDAYLTYVIERLTHIKNEKPLVSVDIEGGIGSLSCLSIATSASESFLVPFQGARGDSFWLPQDEAVVWKHLSSVLSDPAIPKVLQNSLYDNFVLSYSYQCPIRGIVDDTMLKHWEAYCELEKSLGFQASIYTREPFYKDERTHPDVQTFWEYCCKDSAVTYEINTALDTELTTPPQRAHYKFNMQMLNPILYMELRGMRYDTDKASLRRQQVSVDLEREQLLLEALVGRPMNVSSPKFRQYLYEELGLPPQRNRSTGALTANYEALLTLARKTNHPVLHHAIKIRHLRTRESMLRIRPDDDGRIRCGYNVVGSETGRLTCYTSPTGSGYNLQTIPEYDRDLFLADEGYYFFQCDLSGADGWTVAAECARLGDNTMLDDLRAGIKIAKVIAAMFLYGPQVSRLSREELKDLTSKIPKTDPIYFGSKCCQHGSNYGMGYVLLSTTIFIQSEGKVQIDSKDAKRLQAFYFLRYPGVQRWHSSTERLLIEQGFTISASGHRRDYLGRRVTTNIQGAKTIDHETLKQALADTPQENTTYATNMAALRLWSDPENRRPNGSLVIEPLHQVHDALCGQFPKDREAWAVDKVKSYFDNPMQIAGQTITIPFEGRYGQAWGSLEHTL